MTRCPPALASILLLVGLLLIVPGCRPDEPLTGSYQAHPPSDASPPAELKLEADGKGSWKVGKDTAAFKWEARGTKIWLHYRTGGVVTGTVNQDQSLEILVPGVGAFHFEKVK